MTQQAIDAAAIVKKRLKPGFVPKVGIVLGTGLADLANNLENSVVIPYKDLPGFPQTTVLGHESLLVAGYLEGCPVVALKGRKHFYEGLDPEPVKTYVRTLKLLGCSLFLATNAAGSLRKDLPPQSLMVINDHINLQGFNPLVGPNDDRFGTRFPSLTKSYDPLVITQIFEAAKNANVPMSQGVYLAVLGPTFETAAEIAAFGKLGAHAVGMSTVGEVIVARHCGLKVAAISVMTNYATGVGELQEDHDHKDVLMQGASAAKGLEKVLRGFLQKGIF